MICKIKPFFYALNSCWTGRVHYLIWIALFNMWQYLRQTGSPIQWMSRKAWRSTTCLQFNRHTWFLSVLYPIFNCLPENLYNLFCTLKGKKGKITYHRLCSMLTLKNTVVLVFILLLQKLISINSLSFIRIQVQTDFDKGKLHNCLLVT